MNIYIKFYVLSVFANYLLVVKLMFAVCVGRMRDKIKS